MEPEGSLLRSQEPATCPYPQPAMYCISWVYFTLPVLFVGYQE
jgi:hypothetical protein